MLVVGTAYDACCWHRFDPTLERAEYTVDLAYALAISWFAIRTKSFLLRSVRPNLAGSGNQAALAQSAPTDSPRKPCAGVRLCLRPPRTPPGFWCSLDHCRVSTDEHRVMTAAVRHLRPDVVTWDCKHEHVGR